MIKFSLTDIALNRAATETAKQIATQAYPIDRTAKVIGQKIEETENDLLVENLEGNFEDSDPLFNFLDLKVDSEELDLSRPLADPKIIKHQILEVVKYKAPVEIVKELLEKFSFVSRAMKETSKFIDVASDIEEDFAEREELFDEIEELLEDAKSKLEALDKYVNNERSQSEYPDVHNFTDIIDLYEEGWEDIEAAYQEIKDLLDEIKEKEKEIEELEEEIKEKKEKKSKSKEEKEEIKELEKELKELKEELKELEKQLEEAEDDADDAENAHDELIESAETLLEDISIVADELYEIVSEVYDNFVRTEELNEKIRKRIKKAEEDTGEDYDDAIDHGESTLPGEDGEKLKEAEKSLKEMQEELKNYVYEDSFFETLIGYTSDLMDSTYEMKDILEKVVEDSDYTIDAESIKELRNKLNPFISESKSLLQSIISFYYDEEEGRIDYNDDPADEDEANDENKELKDDIDEFLDLADGFETDKGEYKKLRQIIDSFNEYLEDQEDAEIEEMKYDSKKASKSAKSAMKLINTLFRGLGSLLKSGRDELYVNEYILMNFESETPETSFANLEQYTLDKREVEYIIYGLETPGSNYTATIGQLSALRFALNFIGALAEPGALTGGHPLVIFFKITATALKWTIDDINRLGSGKDVELIQNIAQYIKFTYDDYLRIILLMNPGGEKRLQRVAALAEHRTDGSLLQRPTYVSTEIESSVRLWFIPEVAKMLNKTGVLEGRVEGNRFIFRKESYISY